MKFEAARIHFLGDVFAAPRSLLSELASRERDARVSSSHA